LKFRKMSCCPPNAHKYLAPDYKFVGHTETLPDGVEFYRTGDPSKTKKAVLIIPDIYGWNGGRTRNVADYLAEAGYYVVVPKLLVPAVDGGTDGDGFVELGDFQVFFGYLRDRYTYDKLEPRILSVTEHLHHHGIEKIHLLAFCWGGWVGAHLLSSAHGRHYSCMAIGHPSISLEEWAFGKNTQALIDSVTKPMLFMPAKGDPDQYRHDGSYFQSIHSRFHSSETIDFADQEHGFIPRADISIPENKAAVDKALEHVVAFYEKH